MGLPERLGRMNGRQLLLMWVSLLGVYVLAYGTGALIESNHWDSMMPALRRDTTVAHTGKYGINYYADSAETRMAVQAVMQSYFRAQDEHEASIDFIIEKLIPVVLFGFGAMVTWHWFGNRMRPPSRS
jgi:hypothetical protein